MSLAAAKEIGLDAVVVLSDLVDIYLNKCRTKNGTEGFCLWKKNTLAYTGFAKGIVHSKLKIMPISDLP